MLDLNLRFRVQELLEWFEREKPAGIIDLTPGIRSLQIHYDTGMLLARATAHAARSRRSRRCPHLDDLAIPSRIVHLPLSWDDPATRLAIEKYMKSVRPDAPWCPSNIEFIRRINGLDSIEDVKKIVFDASYLVLGLGDVYLGAPVATPLDPRHRLVTTKYNPARTWTAENSVGIGGAYLCVYGMEGPGGYQFVGRTVQMWNTWRTTKEFRRGTPWLLRFFDQIRFYPVEAAELLEHARRFPARQVSSGDHRRRSSACATITRFSTAFATETGSLQGASSRPRSKPNASAGSEAGLDREFEVRRCSRRRLPSELSPRVAAPLNRPRTAASGTLASKPATGWKQGQRLVIVESMKMEIAVSRPAGRHRGRGALRAGRAGRRRSESAVFASGER